LLHFTTIGGVEKVKQRVKMEMSLDAQGMEIPVEMVQLAEMYVKISLERN
jgi:hypothetical protein